MHAGEMLQEEDLPLRYAGFSPCFRREAGAAGRDTRGIFRVHQFDKVEMFSFVLPERAREEHERLLAIEEEIMQALGLPYRVVNIAVDDLGASAAKKYDIEVWLPGQERFRELTSCSNTTDFQARRLDVRYRPAESKGPPLRPHAERHRGGRRADDHRARGERPAGGRQRRAARGAAGVRRAGADRAGGVGRPTFRCGADHLRPGTPRELRRGDSRERGPELPRTRPGTPANCGAGGRTGLGWCAPRWLRPSD